MSDDFIPDGLLDFVAERDRIGRKEFRQLLVAGKIQAVRYDKIHGSLIEVWRDYWLKDLAEYDLNAGYYMAVSQNYYKDRLYVKENKREAEPKLQAALPYTSQGDKGGAPLKYDWAAAAAFMAAFVGDNDYPPQQEDLVKALRKWFEGKGKVPDGRELQRFVQVMYKTDAELKHKRKT